MSRDSKERSFSAACIQFDVRRRDVAHNVAAAEEHVADAAQRGAKLVVLPEMWTTSFGSDFDEPVFVDSQRAEDLMVSWSREWDLVIVGGGPVRDGARCFNRALVAERGRVRGEYRKIHLFTPNAEHRFHEAGERPLILDTELGRIGVVICYDLRFPELIRHYFYEEAEVLVVPAQWPEARADHWRTLLRARAIENEMFVLGCNRTGVEESLKNDDQLVFPGDSRIVDPMGKVLASGAGETGPVLAELQLRKVRTMRRIMPVARDRRPDLYRSLWLDTWSRADRVAK